MSSCSHHGNDILDHLRFTMFRSHLFMWSGKKTDTSMKTPFATWNFNVDFLETSASYLTCTLDTAVDWWQDRSFPILGHFLIWWECADVMEMKHRLEAPVNCFAKTTTLPSYKNPAGQEKSDSLHVRKGVARFNFFCHRIDLFLVSSCVPELYVFLKMEQRIERRNRAF